MPTVRARHCRRSRHCRGVVSRNSRCERRDAVDIFFNFHYLIATKFNKYLIRKGPFRRFARTKLSVLFLHDGLRVIWTLTLRWSQFIRMNRAKNEWCFQSFFPHLHPPHHHITHHPCPPTTSHLLFCIATPFFWPLSSVIVVSVCYGAWHVVHQVHYPRLRRELDKDM